MTALAQPRFWGVEGASIVRREAWPDNASLASEPALSRPEPF
ncbi:MAG: hypothetical protein R2686_00870 [Candidatus Nanopelagicales bacterium]